MDEKQSKKLAQGLLDAVSAKDVDLVLNLDNPNSPFNNPDNWASYGDTDANWAAVGGQTSEPVGALAELIINSIDAVLMRKSRENGVDERGDDAPTSMIEAVNRFFPEVPEGNIALMSTAEQTKLAKRSILLGVKRAKDSKDSKDSKKYPTYTLADFGEGQNADKFTQTLLSLGVKNKEGILFVQGRFNMGSTGSINFCTRSNVNADTGNGMYKFIMSKRTLPDSDEKWGWTLIRVRSPKKGEENPVVQYFYPDEEIPNFRDKSIQAFGRDDIGVIDGGTIVKLYEYDIGSKASAVDFGLHDVLTTSLLECAIPIRIYDFDAKKQPKRSGLRKDGISDRTFSGMKIILSRSAETDGDDDRAPNDDNIGLPTRLVGGGQNKNLGRVEIFATGFNNLRYLLRYPYRCFYTVNGQSQAKERKELLRKADLGDLENHLIVQVDCNGFDSMPRSLIFKSDRERMNQTVHSKELRKIVVDALMNDRKLRAYAETIRQRRIEKTIEKTEKGEEIWNILCKDPDIRALLGLGKIVTPPVRGGPSTGGKEFKGKKYPTMFKLQQPNPPLLLLPINGYRYIVCLTDVEDEYLARAGGRGKVVLESSKDLNYSENLRSGKLRITVSAPSNAVIGEIADVTINFGDPSLPELFSVKLQVEFGPPVEKRPPGGDTGTPPGGDGEGNDPSDKSVLNPPQIGWVYKEEWDEYGFNETSGASCISGESGVAIYVNHDNKYLTEILRNESDDGKRELMEHMFKLSVGILTLSMYTKMKDKAEKNTEDDAEELGDWTDYLELASSGISAHVVTLIEKLGGLKP